MNTRYPAPRATLLLALLLLPCTSIRSAEEERQPVEPASTEAFEIRNIEGFAVYINKKDLADHPAEMREVLDHLQNQYYQVRLTVPAAALAVMQERVPLWLEYDSGPGTSFHPSYRWLLERGYPSPDGLKSLFSICHAKGFCTNAYHQPWVVLHELTHGYDYLYLGRGRNYSNDRLKAAYERAKESGGYDSVLCRYSRGARHYAMSNPMEYFAENTEAYFGTNDFYPFVRAELREHDPQVVALLEDLWGVDVVQQGSATRSLARLLDSPNRDAARPPAKGQADPLPMSKYEKRTIEGWTVYVDPSLVEQEAYGREMCKLLGHKLHLVKRYLPEKAIPQLQQVPIYLEQADPAVPYATYHASAESLKAAGLHPDKLQAIEIGNTRAFWQWQSLQPFAMMNLLARAYYDRFLSEEETAEIEAALDRAAKDGGYDSVLRFDGRHVRHPALGGPVEFFAEMTEAYYGVNDHFPFLQFETKQHDAETCELLTKLWGGPAK